MARILFALIASFSLHALIVETPRFADLQTYASPGTLLVLDIDDTLLIPVQALGTDAWFQHRLKENCKQCAPDEDPLDKTLAVWEAIRHLTDVRIVEKGSEQIIQKLQAKGVPVMGLTTQGLALATRTVKQLHSLHIDLFKTAPSSSDCYFENGHGVLYRQGILFTSGTDKGKALLRFLELNKLQPKRIVFINDKKKHLEEVDRALAEANIPFIGLRYSYSDARVEQYSPELADIQFRHSTFDHLLTDAEAQKILQSQIVKGEKDLK